jgi:glycosyltransferase involved in cell wall biosynthesis
MASSKVLKDQVSLGRRVSAQKWGDLRIRLALLTSDNREAYRQYDRPFPYFGTAPEALLQGFSGLPELEVHVVCCIQRPMACPEKLAQNIWYHGLHVPKFGWMRTGYQGCIRAVRRKLAELKPDIVHGQGTERDCAISAVLGGFPNVLTIHGNMRLIERVNRPRPLSYGWLAAKLEAFTIPRSAGVVCITGYTERAVVDLARKTWVVHNAVDESFFHIQRNPVTPQTILCVGHITVRKNQNRFIEALEPLAAAGGFNVLFLGAAEKTDDYARHFLEMVKTRPWCRYGGLANRDQLKQHLAQASALILPSLEDNCPMVVLEAMAAGVPVAAARVGGVPELIDHGRTGLLFDPKSVEEMRDALRALFDHPLHATQLATAGKTEAQRRFRPEAIARRHLEIYREVLRSCA